MRKCLLIATGGFIGTSARYLIKDAWLQGDYGNFPLDTLIINLTGIFLLSFIMAAAFEVRTLAPNIRLGITTGLLGAFTTFSTISRETAEMISAGIFGYAAMYLTITAVLGFAFAFLGVIAARRAVRCIAGKNMGTVKEK